MSNQVKEYKVVVVIDGVAFLKTDYRATSEGYANVWFQRIVDALQGAEGVNVALYSREVPAEKLEQKFEGDK